MKIKQCLRWYDVLKLFMDPKFIVVENFDIDDKKIV